MAETKKTWRRSGKSNKEETVPLAQDGSFKDHGSLMKEIDPSGCNFLVNGIKKNNNIKQKSEDPNDGGTSSMSTSRKFVFAMSFNVWILYFVLLLWWIPCRQEGCLKYKEWTYVLEDAELTSIESYSTRNTNESVLLAYSDYALQNEEQGNVIALDAENGNLSWSRTLQFIPKALQRLTIDEEDDTILVMGKTGLALINGSNGYILWQQMFVKDRLVLSVNPIVQRCNETKFRILYLREISNEIHIGFMNLETGHKIGYLPSPCGSNSNVELELVSINNGSFVVCRLQRSTTVWSIPTETVCQEQVDEEISTAAKYNHMLSFEDEIPHSDSIVRTVVSKGLMLIGWRSIISAVSVESDLFQEKWRKNIHYSNIKSFFLGHFTSNNDEVAIAVENYHSKITIFIVDGNTGVELTTATLGTGTLESVSLVSTQFGSKSNDVIITETAKNSEPGVSNYGNRTYSMVKFDKKTVSVKELFRVNSYGDAHYTVVGHRNKHPSLVTAESNANSSWTISRRLSTLDEDSWCFS